MADPLRDRSAKGLDAFVKGFAAAVADVRHKLLEEGWFGKAVTPRANTITIGTAGEKSPAQKLGWARTDTQDKQTPAEKLGWFARNFASDESRSTDHAERTQRNQAQERGLER